MSQKRCEVVVDAIQSVLRTCPRTCINASYCPCDSILKVSQKYRGKERLHRCGSGLSITVRWRADLRAILGHGVVEKAELFYPQRWSRSVHGNSLQQLNAAAMVGRIEDEEEQCVTAQIL